MNINMLEITRKNCYKCDLETIIDNDSQYFWINLRDFEVETESGLISLINMVISQLLKYREEIKPDIKVRADKIFVRNDLFEQIIKSCKANNKECLLIKKKSLECLYEENYYTEEIIQIQQDNTKKPSIKKINTVSTKKSTKN